MLFSGGGNPRYSPTGHIIYGLDGALWAVGFDEDRLELTVPTPLPVMENVITKATGGRPTSPCQTMVRSWYMPGTVRTAFSDDLTFVWVDHGGKSDPVPAIARPYQEFSLSPDGTRVAVQVDDTVVPNGADVWILDLASGTPTRLTFDPAIRNPFPTWAPDGRRIAFGGPTLSWKAVDGTGAVEPLVEDDGILRIPHAFFRDGTMLLYEEFLRDFGVVSLEGDRAPALLRESSHSERNADLSPDGRWIAFESNQLVPYDVWVRPFPNVADGAWPVSSGGGTWPQWNPSGEQELYYVGPQGMMAVAFDTEPTFAAEPPRLLFDAAGYGTPAAPNNDGAVGENRRLDIHPDGDRFLMFKLAEDTAASTEVVLVQNWADELRRLVPTP